MTWKPLAGLAMAVVAVAAMAPVTAEATLVARTVHCDEFGFIT